MSAAIALQPPLSTPRRVPESVPPGVRPAEATDRAASEAETLSHERALIVRAQQGDSGAFSALVRLHQRRAYAVARSVVGTHEDAEDAVQEAFLHAYRALDRFRPDQAFGAWLHRIVVNASLDLTRRRRVRAAEELPDSVAAPFRDAAEASDLRARLAAALAKLTDRQRAVIVLHDLEGFKHAEIGEMLDIPEGTARSDLHHARVALRRHLGDLRIHL